MEFVTRIIAFPEQTTVDVITFFYNSCQVDPRSTSTRVNAKLAA